MYITKIHLENIRSIGSLDISFENPAGWHILIGDNGSGKTTVIRAIAVNLLGIFAHSLRINWLSWGRSGTKEGLATITLSRHLSLDQHPLPQTQAIDVITCTTTLTSMMDIDYPKPAMFIHNSMPFFIPEDYSLGENPLGWFSSAFGPFRRLRGGEQEMRNLSMIRPKLAAHISAFGEEFALTETIDWLQTLHYKDLEAKPEGKSLKDLTDFINNGHLLPNGAKLTSVSSDGIFLTDANGKTLNIHDLSDGYRSILGMTFEIIRRMIQCYGADKVFETTRKGGSTIDVPGVVLIDEVDAHLHPTWQARVGEWFTGYFPQLQFIVTTHSPIVCRAATKGSIWRLAAPGEEAKNGNAAEKIEGIALKRLLYGNILDAMGTEVFGKDVTRSKQAKKKLERLAELNVQAIEEGLNDAESREREELRAIFPTDRTAPAF